MTTSIEEALRKAFGVGAVAKPPKHPRKARRVYVTPVEGMKGPPVLTREAWMKYLASKKAGKI